MENLVASFQTVFPLFLLMAVGYAVRRKQYVDDLSLEHLNKLLYKIFLPAMLFDSIYNSHSGEGLDVRLLTYAMASIVGLFFLLWGAVFFLSKSNKQRGVLAHGMFRGNTIIYGAPLARSILGEGNTAQVMTVLGFLICLSNLLGVFYLEIFRGGKFNFKQTVVSVFQNPIISGIFVALLLKQMRIPLPQVLLSAIKSLGGVTTALAFVVLGATFTLAATVQHIRLLGVAVLIKTVAVPLVFVVGLGAYWLGFRGYELVVLLCVFGTPAAVSTFPAAKAAGADAGMAGEIVIFSTAFSVFTLFCFIFFLKQLGFL